MVRARHHAARAVTSQRDSCHVSRGCHEVAILIMIMITITTSHLLAAAAGGWLRPTVAIFSLLFSPAVLCLYCKQLYFYIFFLCFGVIFYYFDPCKFRWLSNKFCSGKNHHQHHVYLRLNINADAHLHSRD